ncbi:hypothetical protein ACET3Z_014110 [Daucus carota]
MGCFMVGGLLILVDSSLQSGTGLGAACGHCSGSKHGRTPLSDVSDQSFSAYRQVLRPSLLRRLKSDVEKGLPPKKETILKVGMSQMQKQYFMALLQKDLWVVNLCGFVLFWAIVARGLLKLITGILKEAFFPDDLWRPFKKQPQRKKLILDLQTPFPVLEKGRDYNLSKFKGDLSASLTIASLCSPRVINHAC